jgi:Na+-translocating ferredoxin:NAD+ oxidoreductase RnfG subunit
MKIKYVVYLVLLCAYGIYYFGVSEGFIKKKIHEEEMTATQAFISLITPQSPQEKVLSLSEELWNERQSLNNFEKWKEKVESGKIT